MMNLTLLLSLFAGLSLLASSTLAADPWIVYEGGKGPGQGKHLVLLAGDEEYRTEESFPMLGQILAKHHGFTCTVLISVNEQGEIDPNNQKSLPNASVLKEADLIVMGLRFRNWPDKDTRYFVEAVERGTPIVALRTSTHAFKFDEHSSYQGLNAFGKDVLGEKWVSHWGKHKVEGTRGVIEEEHKGHPILNGVSEVFGDSDVYEAYPPDDATILMRGAVTVSLKPESPLATREKKSKKTGAVQPINDPMMPVAWVREYKNKSHQTNRVFTTTMGAATDLANEDLRRLVINACYWGLEMEVPQKATATTVTPYQPSFYSFNGFKKGVKPSDLALP